MSENSSEFTDATRNSGSSRPSSDISGTNVPLVLISAYEEQLKRNKLGKPLPKLPSARFCYTNWHELPHTDLHGNQLHAPRVREAPEEKEMTFYSAKDASDRPLHHSRQGKERMDYRDKTENWEQAEVCNLSFQELSDAYQRENFKRILKRLLRVQDLILVEDKLTELSSFSFPLCTHLNLNRNYISSFKDLPKIPRIQYLTISDNNIVNLNGLDNLRKTELRELNLKRNPVAFTENYRPRVFKILPQLKVLDDIPKLPSDEVFDEEGPQSEGGCLIS
ncbi:uncharacterized protein LOC106164504 [Lingula anatina]|uniref:Uncharacterized protein LOC106164504 n=1 Tax=Lingula anatina TaxID=7574 RepID=A0A1S3IJ31_LINAN|nr:uncharacterized protein LOC106164504 [Lingula anatina]|eukprot:XP_013397896.1 uncharacterized protein LOC106164504 [Lingula anatina]